VEHQQVIDRPTKAEVEKDPVATERLEQLEKFDRELKDKEKTFKAQVAKAWEATKRENARQNARSRN